MIKDRTPVGMYEVSDIIAGLKESDKIKEVKSFIEKFSKLDSKKAKSLRESLEKLNIIKLKNSDIIKIVDILPENAAELNKVLSEASLDTDETNKILETVKGK